MVICNDSDSNTVVCGVLLVTTLYAIFSICVGLLSPVECLNEPCNSEGLDSSVLGFATDFYLAGSLLLFAGCVWWNQLATTNDGSRTTRGSCFCCCSCSSYGCCYGESDNSARKSSCATIWTLVCMSAAYVLGGIGHSVYTNSGFDDNAGQQGFYVTWTVAFTFMTISVEETYRFIQVQQRRQQSIVASSSSLPSSSSTTTISQSTVIPKCLDRFLKVSLGLVVAAWIGVCTGYIWCSVDTSIHVDDPIDTVPPLDENDSRSANTCLQIATVAEASWYCSFSLFWIPTGLCLRRLVRHMNDYCIVTGREAQLQGRRCCTTTTTTTQLMCSATMTMILPWTIGIMLILYAGFAAVATGQDGTDVYANIYGAVVYHYGMLLGYYLFYRVASSLIGNTKNPETKISDCDSRRSRQQSNKPSPSGSGRNTSRDLEYAATPY